MKNIFLSLLSLLSPVYIFLVLERKKGDIPIGKTRGASRLIVALLLGILLSWFILTPLSTAARATPSVLSVDRAA